jgi:hypothetical protein
MLSLTNNNTTKNMRSSLNFKNEYNTDNTNSNSYINNNNNNTNNIKSNTLNNNNNLRIINNDKNIGFIAASIANSKNLNIRKEGKNNFFKMKILFF